MRCIDFKDEERGAQTLASCDGVVMKNVVNSSFFI